MAWAEVAVSALLFLFVLKMLKSLIGLEYFSYIREVGKPMLLAVAAGGATYGCYRISRALINSNPWLLISLLVFGALCYALLIAFFERQYFLNYFWLFLGREKGQKTPATQDT